MVKKAMKVIAGTPDRPLIIGNIEIPCYVLEDETRVITQQGFLEAIGRAGKAKGGQGASKVDNPPAFLAPKNLKPFIDNEITRSTTPILLQLRGGRRGYGWDAELLPEVCDVYEEAFRAGALLPSQLHIAKRAIIVRKGLGIIGIIGLIDEATGFKRMSGERELAKYLERYIAKELKPWSKTFPYEFYELIYKLKQWSPPDGNKRTPLIGQYTNDVVYARLAPFVLEELKKVNPKLPTGRRKSTHHQWFTPDFGHPKLKEHLVGVMALMRAAPNWTVFMRSLQRAYPKRNETIPMPLDD